MNRHHTRLCCIACAILSLSLALGLALAMSTATAAEPKIVSHPPLHKQPGPSDRPLGKGPTYYVDGETGDDEHPGTKDAPWRTIQHAVERLHAGDTLCLRGGTYFENVTVSQVGKADAPITIRSFPGEQAVIDGGLPEFELSPETAWEPVEGGAKGEYRSLEGHPGLRDVVGWLGDSMIGLHTYHHAKDLRADLERWEPEDPADKNSDIKPVYCGPGVWYDKDRGRVHVRLAHTHLPDINNYRGETDPRKFPLIISPFRSVPLRLDGARYVVLQDLVIRGGGFNTITVTQSRDFVLENLTVWAGAYGLRAMGAERMKIDHSAFFGSIMPWTFRSDESLRSYPGRDFRDISRFNTHALIVPDAGREFDVFYYPHNDHWELCNSEFAGAHDGLYLGGINVKFHHNRVSGLHDDGIYLSPMYPRSKMLGEAQIHIYQNHFSDALTALAFGGSEPVTSDRIYLYRNIFDMRDEVPTGRPDPKDEHCRFTLGKIIGDHGSPPWSAMNVYHNTFISGGTRSSEMTLSAGTAIDRPHNIYNNVFVHLGKLPALKSGNAEHNSVSDGNLYWTPDTSEAAAQGYFTRFRSSPAFEASKKLYSAGFEANSLVADPQLKLTMHKGTDYRLPDGSPAVNAGVELPSDWPDPLRQQDSGKPDLGALPKGAEEMSYGRAAK